MSNTSAFTKEEQRLLEYLKRNNLRKTPERFEILRTAMKMRGHFDVDSLYRFLETGGYHVSRATVYSTLQLLCSCGLLRMLLFDTHEAKYEMAEKTHSHLVCTNCGEITEINLGDIDTILTNRKFPSFTSSYVSTCIYGICDNCKENNQNKHK